MSGKKELHGRVLKSAINLLRTVTKILEKNKIPYWLENGTLLGIAEKPLLVPAHSGPL